MHCLLPHPPCLYNRFRMDAPFRYLRLRLRQAGLFPTSRLARLAGLLLGIDILLFGLQAVLGAFHSSYGDGLSLWIDLLSVAATALLVILAYRWLKLKLLWRLRNRLIVTFVSSWRDPGSAADHYVVYHHLPFCRPICKFCGRFGIAGTAAESGVGKCRRWQRTRCTPASEGRLPRLILPSGPAEWAPQRIAVWKDGKPVSFGKKRKSTSFIFVAWVFTDAVYWNCPR